MIPPKVQALFNTAIRSLLLHRLRSLLTVLGLVFGVASVIIMLAVAEGASEEAQKQNRITWCIEHNCSQQKTGHRRPK